MSRLRATPFTMLLRTAGSVCISHHLGRRSLFCVRVISSEPLRKPQPSREDGQRDESDNDSNQNFSCKKPCVCKVHVWYLLCCSSCPASPCLLEGELRRHLNLARDSLKCCGRTRRSDGPESRPGSNVRHKCGAVGSRARSGGRWIVELWSVEEVEELSANLQCLRFGDLG